MMQDFSPDTTSLSSTTSSSNFGSASSTSSGAGVVELQVTNIDQTIEYDHDVKQLLISLFSECVAVVGVSVYRTEDGNVGAMVRVPGPQEAQLAISQLHQRRVGFKRIHISMIPADGATLPKKEVVNLLQSCPGGKIQLFMFQQMYNERFRGSISVAELHRMKDVVTLTDDIEGVGRMVHLNYKLSVDNGQVEQLYCPHHCPDTAGWGEKRMWEGLPDVVVNLDTLSNNIHKMLRSHNGSVPLASLLYCYNAECEEIVTVASDDGMHGVPLEHLLQAVKGVLIKTSSTGIKNLVEATPENCTVKFNGLIGPPPALARAMISFTREVVEMLKSLPGCKVSLPKFIPRYHNYFNKQCRVADYGYTKLRDLLEAMPQVVQIIGEGSKLIITLAHKAQMRRFTNDLQKMLKNRGEKEMLLSEFPKFYEAVFFKPFNIFNYGLCQVEDAFKELVERDQNFLFEELKDEQDNTMDYLISVSKRFQTQEEAMRTRGFAKEVVELLRHAPDLAISFNKFIPAYHQHFDRQCRVRSYGMERLIELLEAIPDTVEVCDEGEDRIVKLTRDKMIWVIGEQVECVVKSCRGKTIALKDLEVEYRKMFGHGIPIARVQMQTLEQTIHLLHSWVRLVEGSEGPQVVIVDRGFIRTLANNIRRLLVEQESGAMNYEDFVTIMAARFGCQVEMEMLVRDLSYLVEVRNGLIFLTPLQMCSRDIEMVLGGVGKLPVAELETQFEAKFGRELPLEPLGFDSVTELLMAIPEMSISGRGIRKIVSINQSATINMSPSRPSRLVLPQLISQPQSRPFAGRSFSMRSRYPQTVKRNYPGLGQTPASWDLNMNLDTHMTPASNFFNASSSSSVRFNVPPPSYFQNYPPPPIIGSPQSSFPSLIPTAAPNSPATPTTPRSFNYPWPVYSFFPGKSVAESPVSSGATFQQHMMQLSPSPMITPSSSTNSSFLVQPISRGNPEFGLESAVPTEELSQNFMQGLFVSGQMQTAGNPSADEI